MPSRWVDAADARVSWTSVHPRTQVLNRLSGYSTSELVISATYRRLREHLSSTPRTWVVTGVAGFIGSNLLQELLTLGQRVIGVDDFSTGHRTNLDEVLAETVASSATFRMIEGDIRDLGTCREACAGADYVLHHAALGSVPWSIDDPLRTNSVNVDGFLNMLVAAKDAEVERFVYASSSAVYGDTPTNPQIENSTGRPLSPYAASKANNESYALAFESTYNLEAIGLRYFNVFGRRQDPAGAYAAVIPRWIASMLRGERCRIFGDGSTTRDFCYIANVVQANLLSATANASATRSVYNIACAESITLNELHELIRGQLARIDPRYVGAYPQYDPFRAGDIRFSQARIDSATRELGYVPTHTVAAGIAEALVWYIDHPFGTRPRQVAAANAGFESNRGLHTDSTLLPAT